MSIAKHLLALTLAAVLAGCAAPSIYNPGGGGDYGQWGSLSKQVGKQVGKQVNHK